MKAIPLFVFFLFLFIAALWHTPATVHAEPTSLSPVADAYIRSGSYEDSNYYNSDALYVKNDLSANNKRIAYLKFDFHQIDEVGSVRLQFTTTRVPATNSVLKIYGLENDSWTEEDITWKSAPNNETGGYGLTDEEYTYLGEIVNDAAATFELDVTDFIKTQNQTNDKVATFVILSGTYQSAMVDSISSREGGEAPKLVFTPLVDVDKSPVADAYIRSGTYADHNYGGGTTLNVKKDAATDTKRISYLKFNVMGVSSVEEATLKFTTTRDPATGNKIQIYGLENDAWTESGIRWNDAPNNDTANYGLTGEGITYLGEITDDLPTEYQLDVTGFVQNQADQVVTFVLLGDSNPSNTVDSISAREGTSPPKLTVRTPEWQPVPTVSAINLAQFSDEELYLPFYERGDGHGLPYYLQHLKELAEGVVQTGEHRGFIDISVWRNPKDNQPYNARVMENILSLAYFYCTDRPWNIYYGSTAIRERLEAALAYWIGIQSDEGQFSEYSVDGWNLAATGFATKFMGETLRLLNGGPAIDPVLFAQVKAADRKAIKAVLDNNSLYTHGKGATNQYTTVWAGGLEYLSLYPDDTEIKNALKARMTMSEADFQSPAGYYYERGFVDYLYNLTTHLSNVYSAWELAKGTDFEQHFVQSEEKYYDWLSYNAVLEPDRSGYMLNRGVESRQRIADTFNTFRGGLVGLGRINTPIAEEVTMARAFSASASEIDEMQAKQREKLTYPGSEIAPLVTPETLSFTPYSVYLQNRASWFPSDTERHAAMNELPYIQSNLFNRQRVNEDTGSEDKYQLKQTFIRRPSYYAVFNDGRGTSKDGQESFGLGLIWHPDEGTFVQTQTATSEARWGTKVSGQPLVYEQKMVNPVTYKIDGDAFTPIKGINDTLSSGDLSVEYALNGGAGHKTVTFATYQMDVEVAYSGDFVEYIPLTVAPGDQLVVDNANHQVTLTRGTVQFVVSFDSAATAEVVYSEESASRHNNNRYEIYCIKLAATGNLTYSMAMIPVVKQNDNASIRSLYVDYQKLPEVKLSDALTFSVPGDRTFVHIRVVPEDSLATLTINGQAADRDEGFDLTDLEQANDLVTIQVTAPDGVSVKTYTVKILREIEASADAYIRGGAYADTNYGTETSLDIKKSSSDVKRMAYIKFDYSSESSVTGAKLVLTTNNENFNPAAPSVLKVYGLTNDAWAESGDGGITWNNAPNNITAGYGLSDIGQTAFYLGEITNMAKSAYELDVTSFVAGQPDKIATFVILSDTTQSSVVDRLYAREEAYRRPVLIIER